MPLIQVVCTNCGLRVLVPPTVEGRAGVCFGCGGRVVVPTVSREPRDSDLAFKRGTKISDRYIIKEPIGKGGMGVVYRATDSLLNEQVALKFMFPRLLRTQRGHQLFIQEAQVARRLRHEHIVAVHDVTSTPDGILYLSMEFLPGRSLRAFLRKHRQVQRPVDVRLAVQVIAQILDALDYAHRIVVHRDIKPENIMLMPGERVKVLDFGLAKAIDERVKENSGERPKRIVGTEAYAAPEQKKHLEIDGRADVYAIGLIFKEMLTLRTPLDDPVRIRAVRSDVSPSLLEVLEKATRVEPGARWETAGEFRNALLEAFDHSYRPATAAGARTEAGREVSTESMVFQEGGSFLMGRNDVPEEAPEFEAHVEPFYIDKFPVTNVQYRQFIEATGTPPPKFWGASDLGGQDQPVVGVTWSEANAYAAWAGKQLPTEIQWEFAARGKQNRRYPWGVQDPDTMRGNYGDFLNIPSNVTMHEDGATPEGVVDLAGNVYEWSADPFLPYARAQESGTAPNEEPRRVVRGGSWRSPPHELRCTFRKGVFPEAQLATIGFRCVLSATSAQS